MMIDYVKCPFCGYSRVQPLSNRIEQCYGIYINHLFARCPVCEKAWKYKDVWQRIEKMIDIEEVKEE